MHEKVIHTIGTCVFLKNTCCGSIHILLVPKFMFFKSREFLKAIILGGGNMLSTLHFSSTYLLFTVESCNQILKKKMTSIL